MTTGLVVEGRFWADLGAHGDATALVSGERTITYDALAELVADAREQLGGERRLVLLRGANSVEFVVWYLAALAGDHPVIVAPDDGPAMRGLVDRYDPDVVVSGAVPEHRRAGTGHDLHPDLAVLLSTSGSTGSPKLVRLSHDNLAANTRSIIEYLGLTGDDAALTALPLHYCYGASILHTHLAVGATVVLTDLSVVDPCFWAMFERVGATGLAGVPHTFALLDRIGFTGADLPSLRYLTQAGGRLAPATVRRYAELGQAAGWELFVMYGQTEATARMGYLPPEMAATHPAAVGVAVPGGTFDIVPVDEADEPGVGEVVYRGRNVMLGYAEEPADLAAGRTVDALRTGDLGRINDAGLLEIVGRRARFAKLFGLRIDLSDLEATLADAGLESACASDDELLAVAVTGGADVAHERTLAQTSLPHHAVEVIALAELPRNPSGKPDPSAVLALARAARHRRVGDTSGPATTGSTGPDLGVDGLASLYRSVLALDRTPQGDDTFVSLGGDSLSYVELSIALEGHLGVLPHDWHLRRLHDLAAVEGGRRRRWRSVETSIVLRAIAITLIVGNHADLWSLAGGAHVLLAVAGFNFGRFGSGPPWRTIARVAVPSVVWIGAVAAFSDRWDLTNALLVRQWFGGSDGRWGYWFIETLLALLVPLALLFTVPAVRSIDRRWPTALPSVALAAGLAIRWDVWETVEQHLRLFRPQEVLWLFALGWLAARVRSRQARVATALLGVAAAWDFFQLDRTNVVLAVGIAALLVQHAIRLPRPAVVALGALAGASLHIYLVHWQVYPLFDGIGPAAGTAAGLLAGIAAWRAVTTGARVARDPLVVLRGRRASRAPRGDGAAPDAGQKPSTTQATAASTWRRRPASAACSQSGSSGVKQHR